MHMAEERGALEILKTLLGWSADLHVCCGKLNVSVAHKAAQYGKVSVLRWLFETDPSFLRKEFLNGYTPACYAIMQGQ